MAPTSPNLDSLPTTILILAPQGAEYRAIAKGLRISQQGKTSRFSLQPVPAGQPALIPFLENLGKTWAKTVRPQALLVMGLTGSLNPNHDLGQPVLVTDCKTGEQEVLSRIFQSDLNLSQAIATLFAAKGSNPDLSISFVKGITTTQVICRGTEKQALAQQSGADVVDMENTAILNFAQTYNLPVAIFRVVSDTVDHDLPDLDNIYNAQGKLKPWTLARRFARRPLAAIRLIRGSLIACKVLERLAIRLGKVP